MLLARITGTVVATRKDPRLEGKKLLICQLVNPRGEDEKGYIIAVDTVDAGHREKVLIVQGSSARMAYRLQRHTGRCRNRRHCGSGRSRRR